jgi:hypothetical protein
MWWKKSTPGWYEAIQVYVNTREVTMATGIKVYNYEVVDYDNL